ncbi:YciI family protein [Paraglaciecola sp.]|uniref:YciI family protein n=1 Tax=Paraglaciecola sp. TaxID=1920173 RepID=UPI0030F3EF78
MQYMLLIYSDENEWTEEQRLDCMQKSMCISAELTAKGQLISAAPLHSVTTATSLRIKNGKRHITDGPFAETTEQLGGYYIVDVDNLDQALEIASRLPPAQKGTVEVRPLFPLPEPIGVN